MVKLSISWEWVRNGHHSTGESQTGKKNHEERGIHKVKVVSILDDGGGKHSVKEKKDDGST